jgi:hypothetical protein
VHGRFKADFHCFPKTIRNMRAGNNNPILDQEVAQEDDRLALTF